MVELYIKELVMDDKDNDDYSITIGPTDQCSTITIGSASDTASNGLIFSNTMSDVTYSFDTSDMSGATVGGISSGPSYTFDTGPLLCGAMNLPIPIPYSPFSGHNSPNLGRCVHNTVWYRASHDDNRTP